MSQGGFVGDSFFLVQRVLQNEEYENEINGLQEMQCRLGVLLFLN